MLLTGKNDWIRPLFVQLLISLLFEEQSDLLGRIISIWNKNAYQYDAYHPLQWPSDWVGVSAQQGVSA